MRIGCLSPATSMPSFPRSVSPHSKLLEALRAQVVYPRDQTCCGQPMANSGFKRECAATEALFVRQFLRLRLHRCAFGKLRFTMCAIFRCHRADRRGHEVAIARTRSSSSCTTSWRVDAFPWARFPIASGCTTAAARCAASDMQRHPSCTSRSSPSDGFALEGRGDRVRDPGAARRMLRLRGTFSVFEEVISTKMGYDKVSDHARAGAEYSSRPTRPVSSSARLRRAHRGTN